MMPRAFPLLAVLFLFHCKADPSPTPPPTGLAKDAADVAADTRTLKEAQAAANEVVRAVPDCEAVKAKLDEARRRLAEIKPHVRTQVGRMSLATMESEVQKAADLCP
jgi:cell division septation protein DedD